jgi:uncharacterized protein
LKPNRKTQRQIHRIFAYSSTQLLVIATLVILIVGCQLSGNQILSADSQNSLAQYLPVSATTRLNGVEIELEVALTPEQQAQGLMYRAELGETRGMLFAFSPPRPVGFWMKNTLIPLDIIYLKNQTVTTIHHNVPPCEVKQCPTYVSRGDVDQVIELAAGRAKSLGINIGDRIDVTFLPQGSPENQ